MVRPAYLPSNPHHLVLVHPLRVGVLWQIETNLCKKYIADIYSASWFGYLCPMLTLQI